MLTMFLAIAVRMKQELDRAYTEGQISATALNKGPAKCYMPVQRQFSASQKKPKKTESLD